MRLRLSSYYRKLWVTGALSSAVLAGLLSGCGGGDDDAGDDAGDDVADDDGDDVADDGDGGDGAFLTRPSRSSSIALSDNGSWLANANFNAGTVSFFQTSDLTLLRTLPTGGEPSSIVIGPDNTTAYVANRRDATVVRVRNIDTNSPTVDATIQVGSEPTGLALSPSGRLLFVAEMGESRVTAIDADQMEGVGSIAADRPRAITVTNDLDDDESDETVLVTEFYGEPVAGGETRDDGRTGKVRRFSLELEDLGDITLAPLDSGFARNGDPTQGTVTTAPNQLASLAVADGRVFVTSVSASPEAPTRFDNNVFPVVYAADLATGVEERGAGGSTNLARKVVDAIPSPTPEAPRFIPGDLSGIDFVPGTNIAYVVGKAGDVMVRVVWDRSGVTIGSSQNVQIDLAGNDAIGRCQGPSGIVVVDSTRSYVNCHISGRVGVVDFGSQQLADTLESTPPPQGAAETSVRLGERFYTTGRGRWSNAGGNGARGGEGWSSCASCHPDGLTDNITWVFGAGPRQTTSQDGSFSHGSGPQKQRVFNWTGIFDGHADFERNTRDVAGGLGAITTAAAIEDCNKLDLEIQVALAIDDVPIGGLGKPLKELMDDPEVAICGHKDWDDIDNYVKTIRPPGARRAIFADKVDRGRALFIEGGCNRCHGGAGWTVSRRFFTPEEELNAEIAITPFEAPAFFPANLVYPNGVEDRTLISGQPAIPLADLTGPAEPDAIGIPQVACVLRNVGTFGVFNDTAATDLLERRPFQGNLVRAQGRAGFNVPSLYGLAMGAPYLHHGQAASLQTLLTSSRYALHTNAGNANFSVQMNDPDKLDDLVSFLWSIDSEQPEIGIATDLASGDSFDACPDDL